MRTITTKNAEIVLTVKTLNGSHFQITVQPNDTVMAVKKCIEEALGKDNYPCGQQMLIHKGKVLKDETTLVDNDVTKESFIVAMLTKSKMSSSSGTSSTQHAPALIPGPSTLATVPEASGSEQTDTHDEASPPSNDRNQAINQIMDIGGGTWDKETVSRALQAARDNRERAVNYLYSGIPERDEGPPCSTSEGLQGVPASPRAPNSSPLNMFPQETYSANGDARVGALDFLRGNQEFDALRTIIHENPHILQPMLQELGKQKPQLLNMIQEHHMEFLRLLNEPLEDSDGEEQDSPDQSTPRTVNVTPAEQEAIERLVAMGFDRNLVIEAFLACDNNEEMAANYLLEHAGDFEE